MFQNNPDLRGHGEVVEMTKAQMEEWIKCSQDVFTFANYFNISTDDMKPHILTRRLNVKVDRLYQDYGVYYHHKRANKGSDITLQKLEAKTA